MRHFFLSRKVSHDETGRIARIVIRGCTLVIGFAVVSVLGAAQTLLCGSGSAACHADDSVQVKYVGGGRPCRRHSVPYCPCPPQPAEAEPAVKPAPKDVEEPGPELPSDLGDVELPDTGARMAYAPPGPSVPNMIGDFIGATSTPSGYWSTTNPGAGSVVGRLKMADNGSPMPQDRLIFDYSYFGNVPLFRVPMLPGMFRSGVDVHRFTLGIEKTFLDGLTSLEVKAPMAATLESTTVILAPPNRSDGEFGNLAVTFKGLLLRRATCALSAGMRPKWGSAWCVSIPSIYP